MSENNKKLWEVLSASLLLGLIAAIGSLVFLAWLAEEVLEGETRHFDNTTRTAIHQIASPPVTTFMRGVSFLGSTLFLLTLTTVCVIVFVWWRWKREAILFTITMLGAWLLNVTLKHSFHRARPAPFFNLNAPSSYSFPSGHALAGFCFYIALAAILTARDELKGIRVVIWACSIVIVLLIGLSRIYLGVHYTTDVLAGYASALLWVIVVWFAEVELMRRRNRNGTTARSPAGEDACAPSK